MASPRIMEPVYVAEIQCPSDCITAIYTVKHFYLTIFF